MEKLKEQNEILKNLVIFLARCYQKNYDTFASSQTYSLQVKEMVGEEKFKLIQNVFSHFSTVQGMRNRDLIEEISTLEYSKDSLVDEIREIFPYSVEEKRKEIYEKKWTEEAKLKKLNQMKEIWMEDGENL